MSYLAPNFIRHHLMLSYDALADGVRDDDLVARVLEAVRPVAAVTPIGDEAA